jgi:type IV secretion system protein VirB11
MNELDRLKAQRLYDNFFDDIAPLKKYLDDARVTDIFVGGSGEVIVKRFGEGKSFSGEFLRPESVQGIILSAAALLDKQIDPVGGLPKLEAVLPPPCSARITGLLPPWVARPELALRKPPAEVFPLEDYTAKGRMTEAQYQTVVSFIKKRKNILVGGGTGSGKSTFTNAVLKKMAEFSPDDRFYIVEDVQELRCEARDTTFVTVQPRHAAEAVRTALRWTPDRIIFGELRYGEVANELLKAWNTGHTGNVTTIHADSCATMLPRLEGLLREEIRGALPSLPSAVHLLVHLKATAKGPVVDEVKEVSEAAETGV